MNKKRLKLNELKVKSFVTNEDKNDAVTIKGGGRSVIILSRDPTPNSWCFVCETDFTIR